MRRGAFVAACFCGVSLFVASCGGDAEDAASRRTSSTTGDGYAPAVAVDPMIAERFGAAVEALGLRITRAARYEKAGDHTPSRDGVHLAIYTEPAGPTTEAQYVDRIEPLSDVFLPEVFDQLPHLDTVDICQEPPPGTDDAPEPAAYTTVFATRRQAAAIDWSAVSLLDLVIAAEEHPNRIGLAVGDPIRASAPWQQVHAEAMKRLGESG